MKAGFNGPDRHRHMLVNADGNGQHVGGVHTPCKEIFNRAVKNYPPALEFGGKPGSGVPVHCKRHHTDEPSLILPRKPTHRLNVNESKSAQTNDDKSYRLHFSPLSKCVLRIVRRTN